MKGKKQVKGFKPYNGSYFLYRSLGSETDLKLQLKYEENERILGKLYQGLKKRQITLPRNGHL